MQTASLKVYGLGNAIMDLQVSVSEADFASLGLSKGSMNLVELAQQSDLLKKFKGHPISLKSGGSAANTIIALAQLGAKTAYGCVVADDQFGEQYLQEMASLGVTTHTQPIAGGVTGTSAILITPDAERTMNTHLGVSSELSAKHVSEELISASEWLDVEGHLFSS